MSTPQLYQQIERVTEAIWGFEPGPDELHSPEPFDLTTIMDIATNLRQVGEVQEFITHLEKFYQSLEEVRRVSTPQWTLAFSDKDSSRISVHHFLKGELLIQVNKLKELTMSAAFAAEANGRDLSEFVRLHWTLRTMQENSEAQKNFLERKPLFPKPTTSPAAPADQSI